MNKGDLISKVAETTGISKDQAQAAVNTVFDSIQTSLKEGDKAAFIGFGTLLAGIIGISNIMIYVVKERTKELGIRKALGAKPKQIVGMILQESILITALSGYVGLLLGMAILKFFGSDLETYFIKEPSVSKSVIIGATITLIISGAIAGYIPAKRAARIKPIEALNAD